MKKALGLAAGVALLALSGQTFAASNEVSEQIWIGAKIYDRTFGRGCATCHDVKPNPDLMESIKKMSKSDFIGVLKNGRNGMPKAGAAMMEVGPVKKAGYTEAQAMDAIYAYLKGREDGSVPAGKLKKAK